MYQNSDIFIFTVHNINAICINSQKLKCKYYDLISWIEIQQLSPHVQAHWYCFSIFELQTIVITFIGYYASIKKHRITPICDNSDKEVAALTITSFGLRLKFYN